MNGTRLPWQDLLTSHRCKLVWAVTLLGHRDTLHHVIDLVQREDPVRTCTGSAPALMAGLLETAYQDLLNAISRAFDGIRSFSQNDFINGDEPALVMEILNTLLSAGRSKHVWGGPWAAAYAAIRRCVRDHFDSRRFAQFRVFRRECWTCPPVIYYPRPGEVKKTTMSF